jgi:Tol biopolymer transport system component
MMDTTAEAGKLETGGARIKSHPSGAARFDWIAAALSTWVIGGVYLDGWAHSHGFVDDSFITPWHAVLYSGVLVLFMFLLFHQLRNMSKGYAWQRALPAGFGLSLLGAALFFIGGGLDFFWHALFGVEVDLETLLSPAHLLLATSGALMISGPTRAAWDRLVPGEAYGWKDLGPLILSMTLLLSLLTFFTQFAHPVSEPYAEESAALDLGQYADLYVMNADGSSQTRLTASPDHFAWGSAWSPDGSQVVFSRGEVRAENERAQHEHEHSDAQPAEPENALYLMNSDGSDLRQLTDMSGLEYTPAWSPDGAHITFISNHDQDAQVYTIRADGTGLQQLTDTDATNYGPVWSPDGAQIVYTSNAGGSDQLYLMNADGSSQRQLTSQGEGNWGAAWSPDGSRIVFNSNRAGNTDIYTIHPDGAGEQRLTGEESEQLMPAWSPDGRQIAFVARGAEGPDQIFVMEADGGNPRNLTQNHALGRILYPGWSPDGAKILYSASGQPSLSGLEHAQSLAIASILLQTAIFMGAILILLKRWPLPFGALTFMLTLNTLLMTVFHDRFEFVLIALAAGLMADILSWRLKPSGARQRQYYGFAFAVPVIFYSLYFLLLQLTQGIDWTIHLWLGSIFLAGLSGLFVSFLLVPPLRKVGETNNSLESMHSLE